MNSSIMLPPRMIEEVEQAAEREGRTVGELLQEAVRRYLDQARIRELQDYGRRQAGALGVAEDDVEPLIHEYRHDRRAS